MSHILFITPYFPPEVGAAQTRVSETAFRLSQHGHEVTVLTTLPNYPKGRVFPEYERGQRRQENWRGVRVVRVWSYITHKKGFVARVLSQLSFGLLAPLLALRAVGRPDVIIVSSPPLFDAFAGRALAWLKRCPFIFSVADMWPESAVQLGALRNPALIWLAERLEWSTYQRAASVWALTDGIRSALIARGLPEQKVFLLNNGVDTARFKPVPRAEARAALGWDDRYTVLYAGTIGLAQSLKTVLDASERLRERRDVRFVLAGEGVAKAELQAEAARRGLANLSFLDSVPYELMPTLLSAADVCLVSLKKLPLFTGAIPLKTYEALACARPLLLAVDGEARELIERQARAARFVAPDDGQALTEGVLWMLEHADEARAMGERGRAFVVAHYDRDVLTTELEGHIAAAMGKRQTIGASQAAPALPR